MSKPDNHFIRLALATLAYRAGKVLRDAPDSFAALNATGGVRTPSDILAHMGDLMDWGASTANGKEAWAETADREWPSLVNRFFGALQRFDEILAATDLPQATLGRLLQGPIADAFTHTGQLALLRRMGGVPVKGENYARAEIVVGRVGREQAAPAREF